MSDITNLTGVGVAGLAIYFFYKISSNHINHNTTVLGELRDAIKELKEFLMYRDNQSSEPSRRKK